MPSIFNALNNDPYKPTVLKEHLAQWDNYGIHSFYCVDLNNRRTIDTNGNIASDFYPVNFQSFLAVQVFAESDIVCDFDAIIKNHP